MPVDQNAPPAVPVVPMTRSHLDMPAKGWSEPPEVAPVPRPETGTIVETEGSLPGKTVAMTDQEPPRTYRRGKVKTGEGE